MRGGLMVAAMKSSSLAFDLHSSTAAGVKEGQDIEIKMPSLFAVLAYLMNPATVVFGPFTTFDQFLLGTRASTSLWRPSVSGKLNNFLEFMTFLKKTTIS
jgi:hypothetical protein